MTPETAALVRRVMNLRNVLRDDGVPYGDYVEQLTLLLFLKMAQEKSNPLFEEHLQVPIGMEWDDLVGKRGSELEEQYAQTLAGLAKEPGLLGVIFRKSQNKIQDPAKLKRLVDLIGSETWSGLDVDLKGQIYEELLEDNAQDTKSGAGQYFTPRPLIQAIVEVMRPQPGETVIDVAAGTAGFLLAAHEYVAGHFALDKSQKRFLRTEMLHGTELVPATARLAVMNLFLHGVGGEESPIDVSDALASHPGRYYDVCLTNPPFGKKSSVTVVGEEGELEQESLTYERDDFYVTTSNKQLNFLQHVKSVLRVDGRAAVVLPDNVLFEGGVGEVVRKRLMTECELHTILRLPTGIFYKPGVKANVLFFAKRPAREEPWTQTVWFYDFRTNMHFTLKQKPLALEDLADFVACYNAENRHQRTETERFKSFTYDELLAGDKVSLDITWLKDESLDHMENLPEPAVVAAEIVENLRAALDEFEEVAAKLNRGE